MPRNRTIYNVLALYAGQTNAVTGRHSGASGDIRQITRVQTFDEDFARNLTNVEQYGNLAAIDRIELEAPTVKSSFSYYITDGGNEKYLGLAVATGSQGLTSCVSDILTGNADQRNYFLAIADEGNDIVGYTSAKTGVIGIGNGFITSYDVEAAVGEIPKATVQLEGLNVRVYANASVTSPVPAVNPADGTAVTTNYFVLPRASGSIATGQVTALQPGDINLTVTGTNGVNIPDLKIQSFKMSIPLSRQPIRRLGNKFAFTRQIQFPITTNFSIEAEMGDVEDGNLADLLCQTGLNTMTVSFDKPDCGGNGPAALLYQFRGAKLVNQKVTTSIGANAKFSAEFEAQIGAPQDINNGVFISGTYVNY